MRSVWGVPRPGERRWVPARRGPRGPGAPPAPRQLSAYRSAAPLFSSSPEHCFRAVVGPGPAAAGRGSLNGHPPPRWWHGSASTGRCGFAFMSHGIMRSVDLCPGVGRHAPTVTCMAPGCEAPPEAIGALHGVLYLAIAFCACGCAALPGWEGRGGRVVVVLMGPASSSQPGPPEEGGGWGLRRHGGCVDGPISSSQPARRERCASPGGGGGSSPPLPLPPPMLPPPWPRPMQLS